MIQEEIFNGNKLIAEFMELQFDGVDWVGCDGIIHFANHNTHNSDPISIPYHLSWNCLMPVFFKINKMYRCMEIKKDHVQVRISGKPEASRTSRYKKYGEIGALYRSIVEFIKWYNENK